MAAAMEGHRLLIPAQLYSLQRQKIESGWISLSFRLEIRRRK